ncbi:MAG: phenylalanine--tRNA ligase subunit beta [Desulfobulbaceae bacterium]|nr:phenylalanine--tRNA ligase subunit beta [Desulfobulbaceae bacterium]
MKFTLKWLEKYVSIDGLTPDRLADKLTMLGLEVDAVKDMSSGLEGILTAKIIKVRKHPDADRLTLCDVEVGDEIVSVVCGAPNAREGLITAIARPGVTLPNGMKIKKAKVRGQESYGMLCAEDELGLSDDHGGILEIEKDVESGVGLIEALGLDDVMIEIDLTPNRPDCTSVIGIAREVSGFTGNRLVKPVKREDLPVLDGTGCDYRVEIEEPELCPRYAARKLTGVTIGPSPLWMQQTLLAVGMRPINNIVDITNFVMLETGQPLHAFDFSKLSGRRIVVRCPSPGDEKFTTLDGNERSLDSDMLMICDGEHPVAVAGIMGGLDSEVTRDTTEILLESASFNPVSIRKTARKLNISSEASYRFERGVDPDGVDIAMQRAVNLMVEFAGARLEADGIDKYPGRKDTLVLILRVQRVCELLGMDLSSNQVAEYLRNIEFGVEPADNDILNITVPSFRVDIEREIDLVEEIARLVGYNDIPTTLPKISMDYPQRDSLRSLRQEILSICTSRGFTEAINYSFASEKHADILGLTDDDDRRKVTMLLNPLTEDQSVMRSMILPGMLENVRHNLNHQKTDISLFEIGKIFIQYQESIQPEERFQLCAVMSGNRYPDATPLYFSGSQADIFDLKGIAQSIIEQLGIIGNSGEIFFRPVPEQSQPYCQNGFSVEIVDGNNKIGLIGKIKESTARGFGVKQDVYFFEMDLSTLNDLPRKGKSFKTLPRYPSVNRDIALVLPETVGAGELLQAILDSDESIVENADLFDVYRGKPIEQGMKSVALSITYRSADKTLDDETVDILHNKIVSSLMSRFGGRYREGQE